MPKRKPQGDLAWTGEGNPIFVPEVRIDAICPTHIYVPTRGYVGSLAVFDGPNCIGWMDVRTLGYETVKDWIAGAGWAVNAHL